MLTFSVVEYLTEYLAMVHGLSELVVAERIVSLSTKGPESFGMPITLLPPDLTPQAWSEV